MKAKYQFNGENGHFCSILYKEHKYITELFSFLVSVLVSKEASVYAGDKNYWNQIQDACSGRVIPQQIKNFNNLRRVKSRCINN